ncbi:MAG: 50S ribosomal protein L21 [Coriobacteriia bacterium]|nr:50S ribosomal protein L21 [Actinomycetota bacterium]MDZ4167013.1 50S ribosomal protein L21 [Coriobacteriia bacterium]
MYAVINSGGKQAKVEQGTIVAVERLSAEVGDTVSLPVIFVADGDTIYATAAELGGASVTAEVLEHFKGEKQIVFKFKKRKGYKRTKGHRQTLTSLRVTGIAIDGAPVKAEKPAPKAEKPAPVEAATEEARVCAAVKSDGSPCTNKAKDGSEYCGVHAKK